MVAKDVNGNIDVLGDHERKALYTKPMIVLVDKLSASASEIFAAAMQDYGRALIVSHNPQLQDTAKDVQRLNERLKNNRLSLNESARRAEMAKDAKRREMEEAERRNAERADQSKIYELSLADVSKPQLPLLERTHAAAKPALRSDSPVDAALGENEDYNLGESGPVKREALSILSDLIDFSNSSRTVHHRHGPPSKGARSGRFFPS